MQCHYIPENMRVYAIGDIHGRHDLLLELHRLIEEDIKRYPIGCAIRIYLGDYIDKGPNSSMVIETLVNSVGPTSEAIFLLGNHEYMLQRFLISPTAACGWLYAGGLETLLSYGVDGRALKNGRQARSALR